jgi:GTPase SAR1 family protein
MNRMMPKKDLPTTETGTQPKDRYKTKNARTQGTSIMSTSSTNNKDACNTLIGNAAMQDFLRVLSSSIYVSKWGIELPMIAVFGDTSSGKSSLLSNLAMIELPSNHSLTTRCPIRLELRRAETREARITVQRKTNTHRTDLPDFKERIAYEDNWDSIPQLVQEAQAHILQHTQKTVSPNIISLSVSGPNLGVTADHPLTLVDLPGWVQSRGKDDAEDMVPDIQHLVKNYINNPRCIILAVLPGNVDFHNSPILALAQQVDPEGQRTLPVITKPDLIDEGGEGNVLELLLGNKIKLKGDNQFHIIKGRGQAALDKNVSIHVGLEDEAQYFETEEPWKSVTDRALFGTSRLRRKLGAILWQHVQQSVPPILQEIQAKQQLAEVRRIAMGGDQILTTVADRRRFYQDTCSSFVNHLKSSLSGKKEGGDGRSRHASLRNGMASATAATSAATTPSSAASQLYEACSTFMTNIRNGSLNTVRVIVEGAQVLVTSPHGDVRGEVVHLDKEFACIDCTDVDNEQDNTGVLFEYRGYTSQQKLEEDDVWSDGEQIFVAREGNVFDSLRKIPLKLVRTDPLWLKDKIAENRTDDLGCFLNVST